MEIKTNNHPRELLHSLDVPDKILSSQFEYQTADQRQNGYGYIRYQKNWYHLDQFTKCDANSELAKLGYSGYYPDSFFSGVLVKIVNDEQVIMASYRV